VGGTRSRQIAKDPSTSFRLQYNPEAMPSWVTDKDRLRVAVDAHSRVEISCPVPGVIRVRHAPSAHVSTHGGPQLPKKDSFAVVAAGLPLPLAVGEVPGGGLRVRAQDACLTLGFDPFGWTFGEGSARCVEVHGDAQLGYPLPFYRSRLVLHAPDGEAYLGFGEKVGPLDKRGMRLTLWNTDVLPHQPDTDPLYASVPFFVAVGREEAWGLFLDETWRSEVDVAQARADRLEWMVNGPELDAYLIAGPTPAQVLERYTALTGRPPLPPLWSLGAHQSRWGYESDREVLEIVAAYRAHGLPLDCVHLDIDHLEGLRPLSWDQTRFGAPERLVERAAESGVKLVAIVDPAIARLPGEPMYEEARAQNHLVRDDRGEVLVGEVWPTECVWPDFTRKDVRRFWASAHQRLLTAGIRGLWNDMNEPSCFRVLGPEKDLGPPPGEKRGLPATVEGKTLPYDARHGARRHLEVHNVYALGMAQAAVDAQRRFRPGARPFVLTRAGFAGIQRYAALWTGDNSSHWTHLELGLAMLQGLGVSGVPFVGADVPGFLGRPDGELMLRWTQAGIFYPFMRNHSARGTPPKEPWRFGETWLGLARDAVRRRYRLLPTLYTLMQEASVTGAPALRPLAFHHPEDADARWAADQFLFGPDVLLAPVTRPGQTRRMVYLPRGRWHPFSDLRASGGAAVEGPAHVLVDAPLAVTPAFLRAGGGIALTAAADHTTTARWPEVEWHLGLEQEAAARLYEDDGDGDGPWRTTTLRARLEEDGALALRRAHEGTLTIDSRPERLVLHGLPIAGAGVQVEGAEVTTRWEGTALVLEGEDGWRELRVTASTNAR
jgi:alpha-glucosidase